MRLRLLRLFLAVSGFVWAVSIVGVFVPWSSAENMLLGMGAQPIAYDPMLDYWLRMASGAFFLVGIVFLLLAAFPRRYVSMIPVFGWLMLAEGAILAFHGFRLGLRPFPFYGDISSCFVLGAGILVLRNAPSETKANVEVSEGSSE